MSTPVYVLSYKGAVCADIGKGFSEIVAHEGIELSQCRLTAKTRDSGAKSIGAYPERIGESLVRRLADAAMSFHHAASPKELNAAVSEAHKIALTLSNQMKGRVPHQRLMDRLG
ncbi:MAG: hypothetical protein GY789_12155 [Hyphomicrobiales bacterium]|nr:hypothetical protein [Hyphomicrobiales bacterium]